MPRQGLSFIPLLLALGLGPAACGSSSDGDDLAAEIEDVVFLDETTDEALINLLASDLVEDDERLVVLDEPADTDLTEGEVPAFAWHYAATARRAPTDAQERRGGTWTTQRLLKRLGTFLNPIGTAHAHGVPYNGTAYFLEFTAADDDAPLLRVFVGQASYAMAEDAWQDLAATGELALRIRSAEFENNLVVDGGGPFEGGHFAFSVQ